MATNFEVANKIRVLARISGGQGGHAAERKQGEWSDMDGNIDGIARISGNKQEILNGEIAEKQIVNEDNEPCAVKTDENSHNNSGITTDKIGEAIKDLKVDGPSVSDNHGSLDCSSRVDVLADGLEESSVGKPKKVRGVEGSYALRFANNPLKRPKVDKHKEAMLGKKRARQTVLINAEDARQASSMKTTPKRQTSFPEPIVTGIIRDTTHAHTPVIDRGAEWPNAKDQEQVNIMGNEGSLTIEITDKKNEPNGDVIPGGLTCPKKQNHKCFSETYPQVPRSGSWKQYPDHRQFKSSLLTSQKSPVGQNNRDQKLDPKKNLSLKRQTSSNPQYQDTSVERFLREVTSEKFWHNPG